MPDNWKSYIETKYLKEGYIDKYGGSVLITSVICITFAALVGYHQIKANTKALKKDWPKIRCNPLIMPFAGIINGPPEGSKWEYTGENFGHCLTNTLKDITKVETAGLNAAQGMMKETVTGITDAVQEGRSLMSSIRNIAGTIIASIYGKIMNVLLAIRLVLIKSLDSMNKVGAVGATSLFTALGGVLSIKGFVFAFLIGVIFVLILIALLIVAMLALAIPLSFIPFVGPFMAAGDFILALAATVFLIVILVIFIPLISVVIQVLYLTRTVPRHRRRLVMTQSQLKAYKPNMGGEGFTNRMYTKHFCFDPDTIIHIKGKGDVKMKEVELSDMLEDGARVTSILKLASKEPMYKIKGIKVTGNHKIDDPDYGIILVKNHPESKKLIEYQVPHLYNINTTSKRVTIKGVHFMDYDEIDEMDIATLRHFSEDILPKRFAKKHIHEFLESGLDGKTKIELEDGRSVSIKDININDQLKFGERVLGIVKIDGRTVNSVKLYNLENTKITCTGNIKMIIKDLGVISIHNLNGYKVHNAPILYNIITDMKSFMINDVRILDYGEGIESLLWQSKFNRLSIVT